jgi:hypothetical protein
LLQESALQRPPSLGSAGLDDAAAALGALPAAFGVRHRYPTEGARSYTKGRSVTHAALNASGTTGEQFRNGPIRNFPEADRAAIDAAT